MKSLLKFVGIGILAVAASGTLLAQSNPLVGTWKLNSEKSKFNPGPAPKSLTRTVAAQGDGVLYTFDGISADGTTIAYSFALNFDGKDNAITGSMPSGADSISAQRIDSNTFAATLKQAGKVIGTSKVEVSQDGKVTTVTSKGATATGQATNDVSVYNKQ
ncbi:MAG: hypothetical protein WA817_12675 [Candidatus Acidiferrum sp.]